MAHAMDIADYIIDKSKSMGTPVSNLKLQKTMYFLNAMYLLESGAPLIDDVPFEKWDYGPVIHEVYSEYSHNGASDITNLEKHISDISYDSDGKLEFEYSDFKPKFFESEHSQEKKFIDDHLNLIINFAPFVLVNYSHKEPQWQDKSDKIYDNKKTRAYYEKANHRFWEL